MLFTTIHPDRWFIWTVVFLFVIGVSLISYIQWVNIEFDTVNSLMIAQV
ncbi:MAG: hypothetical protein HY397_00370 [Candidatus Doudnabacteria bacterium]|nr:hypothetical protein [Candidatus Doudnabacteria bacterium]